MPFPSATFGEPHVKPPLIFHDKEHQVRLLLNGTREQLIEWLAWNDPNGTYTDKDSVAEGIAVLTLERAREIMRGQIDRDKQPSVIPRMTDTATNDENNAEIDRLVKTGKYAHIVAWGKFLGFTPATVMNYVRQAELDAAPDNVIQKTDGRWLTLDDIQNDSNRRRVEEIACGLRSS